MIRRYLLFGVALFLLSGSVVATLATIADRNYQLRGYVDATTTQNLPFRIPRLGVNAELTQYSPSELEQQLELMQAAHVSWVRQFIRWDEIEAIEGEYDWTIWDQVFGMLADYTHVELIAVLMNSPEWAHQDGSNTAPPQDITHFGQFASAFAARYGQSVDYYQIWDEPNLTDAWGGFNPRPSQYAALLQETYQQIHAADLTATVISAALAPTTEQGPRNISDIRYLEDLYLLEAHHYMDAVAAKPYGFDSPPTDRTVEPDVLNFSRIIALREVMEKHGDSAKALWASNWGWNSLPADWRGAPSIWGQVTREQQVQYTLQALERAEREWPWLGGMTLHHWQPNAPSDDPIWGFSLIDMANRPTPLWHALSQYEIPSNASNGIFPAANPYASYSGVWTFSDLGADIGWVNDSRLSFDFLGQDVALLLRQDDYVAYLYPTIDGKPANALPMDVAGNSYIVLTSASREPELNLVVAARNLSSQPHQLDVVVDDLVPDEAQDRWALAGYAVSSGDMYLPYQRQIVVSFVTVLVALVAVVVTGLQMPWQRSLGKLPLFWHSLNGATQLAISALTSIALMLGLLITWGDSTPALFRRETVQLGLAFVTAGLIYVEPGLILTLLSFLMLLVIVYNRLEIGLALIVFWSPFFLFPVELFIFSFPMSELLIILTTVAWILRGIATWGRHRQTTLPAYRALTIHLNNMDWAIIIWVNIGIMSLLWAEWRSAAITELRTLIIEPSLFYAMIRINTKQKKTQFLLMDALLIAGFTVAMIGLIMFFKGDAIITAEDGVRRLASIYGSPNNVGLFLGRCLPFALAYILIKVDLNRRIIATCTFFVIGAALLLSQSAGALFIGIPLSVACVLLLAWRNRALLPLAGLTVIGVGGLAFALRSARFARLLDFTGGTNFARIRVWHSAINMIRDHPITGIGLDQFLYAFRGAYITPDAWQEPNLSHPHNFVLDFWLRLGLMGLLIFVWIQLIFWVRLSSAYMMFRRHDPLYFALVCGLAGSMVNLMGHGLVDNSVFVNDLALTFMLLLGIITNLTNTPAIDDYEGAMV